MLSVCTAPLLGTQTKPLISLALFMAARRRLGWFRAGFRWTRTLGVNEIESTNLPPVRKSSYIWTPCLFAIKWRGGMMRSDKWTYIDSKVREHIKPG
jgi:hypothetical protein